MESIGRSGIRGLDGVGFGIALMAESLYWLVAGRWSRQPVRLDPVMAHFGQKAAHLRAISGRVILCAPGAWRRQPCRLTHWIFGTSLVASVGKAVIHEGFL